MSSEALPISPARFAEALKDLSLSSLHLKVLELRNSIAHLDYSNEQLRPFASGAATAPDAAPGQPDPDCLDAIRENDEVIARMQARIALVRAEVEGRGSSWTEFQSKEEMDAAAAAEAAEAGITTADAPARTNGVMNGGFINGEEAFSDAAQSGRSSAWTDGTFQTGVIRNGEVHMDSTAGQRQGGSLTDEELRRRMEAQLRNLDDEDEDGGMHL